MKSSNKDQEQNIIPCDRPTLGHDLELLRERLKEYHGNCSVKHMLSALGISSRNKWQELTDKDKKGDLPLQDASLALLARFYDRHPGLFPKEHGLTIGDVLTNLTAHAIPVSASRFAVLVGRSKTVGPKWVGGTQPDPSANAAINIIDMLLKSDNLEYWLAVAEEEAIARGLKSTKGNPGADSAQDRLGIDSWGARKRNPEYDGTDRRSKVNEDRRDKPREKSDQSNNRRQS